ncbi:MAG TPA: dephospho-CoA kinase, partial [Polyangiaceae bacterium]
DRAGLALRVFSDERARRALDAIVHPIVGELAAEHFRAIAARGEPLACYEVPLLYEGGLERTLSPVVVVNSPTPLIRARLKARDGYTEAQIEARIAAQMPLDEKVRRADYVLQNDGTLAQLRERADSVFDALCAAVGVKPARYARPSPTLS